MALEQAQESFLAQRRRSESRLTCQTIEDQRTFIMTEPVAQQDPQSKECPRLIRPLLEQSAQLTFSFVRENRFLMRLLAHKETCLGEPSLVGVRRDSQGSRRLGTGAFLARRRALHIRIVVPNIDLRPCGPDVGIIRIELCRLLAQSFRHFQFRPRPTGFVELLPSPGHEFASLGQRESSG